MIITVEIPDNLADSAKAAFATPGEEPSEDAVIQGLTVYAANVIARHEQKRIAESVVQDFGIDRNVLKSDAASRREEVSGRRR